MRHVEDSNLQAAAAELRPLLSHTADALDDVVTMRAAALLVEVYLRQGVSTAASGTAGSLLVERPIAADSEIHATRKDRSECSES